MKLAGKQKIQASRQAVWVALNDPEVLRQCIPGCQSLEKEADDRLKATVEVKIGPIGARFNGAVTISDQHPPESYTISGEGQGGTVGAAKGAAHVRLTEDGDGTLLTYDVDVQVSGRLAQLGGPIIDATAKQLAGRFFRQLGEVIGQSADTAPAGAEVSAPVAASQPSVPAQTVVGQASSAGGFPAAWLLALLSSALIGFLVGRAQVNAGSAEWIGLSVGLLVVVVAGVGFEFGRRTNASVVVLDTRLLQRLTRGDEA